MACTTLKSCTFFCKFAALSTFWSVKATIVNQASHRSGRYYGSGMDALRERMGSGWTLLRMPCVNGWGRSGRYYGSGMDALHDRIGSGWTILRFQHPAWMLCLNGWGRGARYYGSGMDALLRHVRDLGFTKCRKHCKRRRIRHVTLRKHRKYRGKLKRDVQPVRLEGST